MTVALDHQSRAAVLAAAYAAAGPKGGSPEEAAMHAARVQLRAVEIAVELTDDKSWFNRAIEQVLGPNTRTFTGTVLAVDEHMGQSRNGGGQVSTTRKQVTFRTRVHQEYAPDGTEQALTERTDSLVGKAIAKRLERLLGHRVLVWVETESFQAKSGATRKSRVIRHVVDLALPHDGDD